MSRRLRQPAGLPPFTLFDPSPAAGTATTSETDHGSVSGGEGSDDERAPVWDGRSEAWADMLADVSLPARYLSAVIMEYFVVEGHSDAAGLFATESGTASPVPLAAIDERLKIRQAVMSGRVARAVELTSALHPDLFNRQPALLFRLHTQAVADLVVDARWGAALTTATTRLRPLVDTCPHLLSALEDVMALFAFPDPVASPCGGLLTEAHRMRTADMLNAAILAADGQHAEPRVTHLLRQLKASQERLARVASFPVLADSRLAAGSPPP